MVAVTANGTRADCGGRGGCMVTEMSMVAVVQR